MSIKSFVLACALLGAAAQQAQAQVGISADLGTTGAGFHLVVPMASELHARVGANYAKHDFDRTSDNVDYAVKGKLQTFDLLLDWYPRAGGAFRLTGGLVYNGNRFDATAQGNQFGKLTLNGHTYTAADAGLVKGRIAFRKAAPYLGLGWGNALDAASRWHFNADLGAFYQGSADVQLAGYGCTISKAACDALASDIAAERLRLQQDVKDFKLYPVLRASLGYRF